MYYKTAFSESCEIGKHMLLPFLEICLNRDAGRGWFASIHKFWSWRKVPIYLTAERNEILCLPTQEQWKYVLFSYCSTLYLEGPILKISQKSKYELFSPCSLLQLPIVL